MSTSNRSILAIEDIDCSVTVQDRENGTEDHHQNSKTNSKVTLPGMLNFIDGLWSSCVDERIFIFTTNRLDPALVRPGRMDMHIHLSYCTIEGIKLLASSYHGIHGHRPVFEEIEGLLKNVKVTPA
ncbi:AAA-ATPase At2g18193-like isoform X2 [Fagus crenata]